MEDLYKGQKYLESQYQQLWLDMTWGQTSVRGEIVYDHNGILYDVKSKSAWVDLLKERIKGDFRMKYTAQTNFYRRNPAFAFFLQGAYAKFHTIDWDGKYRCKFCPRKLQPHWENGIESSIMIRLYQHLNTHKEFKVMLSLLKMSQEQN